MNLAGLSGDFDTAASDPLESQMNSGEHQSLGFKAPTLGTSATQAKRCITTSPQLPTITIATTGADYLSRHFNSGRGRPSFSCNFPKSGP